MLPQDVPDKVWSQLQEALFTQGTQCRSIHTELLEVHTFQTELIDSPHHPIPNMGFCPLPGVWEERSNEDAVGQAGEKTAKGWNKTGDASDPQTQ